MKKHYVIHAISIGIILILTILVAGRYLPPKDSEDTVPLWGISYGRDPDMMCCNRLEDIGRLIRSYNTFDSLEPIYYIEKPGIRRPVSWRQTLAEYDWGMKGLSYKFENEYVTNTYYTWENSANREKWSYFMCSREAMTISDREKCNTSFLMLVRDGIKMSDLPETAIIIVESSGCGIHWMEPKDLNIETLKNSDSPFGEGMLNSSHDNYVHALRKNGDVVKIDKNLSKEEVLLILDGGSR